MRSHPALVCLSLVACADVTRSTNVDTAGFYAVYTIVDDEAAAPVASAVLRARDEAGPCLELVHGDAIDCDGVALPPTSIAMSPGEPFATLGYRAEVPVAPAHVFTLTREGEAPIRHAVTLQGPLRPRVAPAVGSYDDHFTLRWDGAPTPATVRVEARAADARCRTLTLGQDLDDTGIFIVHGPSLAPSGGARPDCVFTLTVIRTRSAPPGAPFHGGALRAVSLARTGLRLR